MAPKRMYLAIAALAAVTMLAIAGLRAQSTANGDLAAQRGSSFSTASLNGTYQLQVTNVAGSGALNPGSAVNTADLEPTLVSATSGSAVSSSGVTTGSVVTGTNIGSCHDSPSGDTYSCVTGSTGGFLRLSNNPTFINVVTGVSSDSRVKNITTTPFSIALYTFCATNGTITFDGSGNFNISGQSICNNPPNSSFPTTTSSVSLSGTYSVSSTGAVTIGSMTGQILLKGTVVLFGGPAGGTFGSFINGIAIQL